MKTENLIPFDLDIALKHPERVRHITGDKAIRVIYVPEAKNYEVVVVWVSGSLSTYDLNGCTSNTGATALCLVEETKVVPWKSIDEVPEGVYFRFKQTPNCYIANGHNYAAKSLLMASMWVTLEALHAQYEFSPNRNGPWQPCGKEITT